MSLAGLGLLASRFPAHAATRREGLTRTREILEAIIREHAAAKDEPWLLMHGIRALGKDFRIGDEPAVAYLCRRYLQETTINGKSYLYMPTTHEGHTNAFLGEAVLDSGIDATYAFRTNDRDYTVADLTAGAKALFNLDTSSISSRSVTFNPDDLAFSLIAFAYSTDPAQDEWVNGYGKAVRFSAVVEFGLETLESANKLFEASMRKGLLADAPDHIYDFTCGGTHLIYGLSTCLRFGHARQVLAERIKTQFDILVWRLKSDLRLTDRYYSEAAAQYSPEMVRMYYLDAKLKSLGHALEVLNHARRFSLFVPTSAQEDDIGRAHEALLGVVEAIGTDGPKNVGDESLYKLLVGDACHAYRGVTMASAA
jgi:hypothetical protein